MEPAGDGPICLDCAASLRDYYATKTETPLFLLRNRLILPILDGLDDIPENLWPEALHAIDRATHANLPLVLTCRTDEYSRAVVQAGTTLVFSVAIEIQGVEVKEALRYLRESTPLDPGRWDGVEERQAEHPDGALAAALSSPLLVYLMRVAYSRRSANPTELAAQRFRTPERLQRHLLGNYVPSLYQEVPARPWQKRKKQGLDSRKATVASHAIAAELSRNKTIEFNWWALGRHFSYAATELTNFTILLALAGGLGYLFLKTLGHSHLGYMTLPPWLCATYGVLLGAALAITPTGMIRLAAEGVRLCRHRPQ